MIELTKEDEAQLPRQVQLIRRFCKEQGIDLEKNE